MKIDYENGQVLLVNKPLSWTSFDVVKKVRNILRIKKIGHAGTLDPLAEGLLILCTGKFTKKIEEIQAEEKEYTGHFTLGQTTPSFDLETEIDTIQDITFLNKDLIIEAAQSFVGFLDQIPPLYSAVKINGERAYTLARRGDSAEIKAKQIHIKAFQITGVELPLVSFRVVCSKGTYIRSLARDFGEKLGCGAHLSKLVRTRIGPYHLSEALTIDDIFQLRRKQVEDESHS